MRVSVLANPLIWQETLVICHRMYFNPQTFAEDIVNHFKNTKVKVDVKDYDTLVSEGFELTKQ